MDNTYWLPKDEDINGPVFFGTGIRALRCANKEFLQAATYKVKIRLTDIDVGIFKQYENIKIPLEGYKSDILKELLHFKRLSPYAKTLLRLSDKSLIRDEALPMESIVPRVTLRLEDIRILDEVKPIGPVKPDLTTSKLHKQLYEVIVEIIAYKFVARIYEPYGVRKLEAGSWEGLCKAIIQNIREMGGSHVQLKQAENALSDKVKQCSEGKTGIGCIGRFDTWARIKHDYFDNHEGVIILSIEPFSFEDMQLALYTAFLGTPQVNYQLL